MRLALKLATGAGKTTVMAMLIAWQTDQRRAPAEQQEVHTRLPDRGAGLTIRDRLRVLQPNDPDSYYASRELVPGDMLGDLERAKIVITNYHAFKLRERLELSKGGRLLLQGRRRRRARHPGNRRPDAAAGDARADGHQERHGHQRRGAPLLPREARRPTDARRRDLKGDDKKEAEKNNEAARLWISGIEAVKRKLGVTRVIDLSATPSSCAVPATPRARCSRGR
jgi:type III restriction enzyme